MPRPRPFPALAMLAVLGATGLAGCSPAPVAPSPPAPGPDRAVELVESAPIETTLDHPGIRDAAEVWLEMIAAARASIDLGEFYASNQQPSRLEPIVQALEAALARGVRVRFLAEHSFVATYPDTLERLARAGAQVRHLDLKPTTGGILHAKYFLVDDREAFLGSQNFDWRALEHNYELGARVRDPAVVGGIAAIFAADWARAGGEPAPEAHVPPPHGGLALVASPPALLPPGVAWDELEAPLVRAAARGVRVELLLADWSKRPASLAGLQRLARIRNIAIRLTTIPAWSGGFVPFARVTHAKALVVDGRRGWLGTSNWEKEYFYSSRNLGLIVEDPAIVGQLVAFFATLWQSSYAVPLDPDAAYAPPRIE